MRMPSHVPLLHVMFASVPRVGKFPAEHSTCRSVLCVISYSSPSLISYSFGSTSVRHFLISHVTLGPSQYVRFNGGGGSDGGIGSSRCATASKRDRKYPRRTAAVTPSRVSNRM